MLIEEQLLMVVLSIPPAESSSRRSENRFVTETIKHFNGFSAALTAVFPMTYEIRLAEVVFTVLRRCLLPASRGA